MAPGLPACVILFVDTDRLNMKTRGKRTGADDEKPVDETEEKPVRKRAKKKANHVSEETEDPPCKL